MSRDLEAQAGETVRALTDVMEALAKHETDTIHIDDVVQMIRPIADELANALIAWLHPTPAPPPVVKHPSGVDDVGLTIAPTPVE